MTVVIKNKRIIVTGGAKGLGFALIQQLLEKGAKSVSILDCDVTRGVKAAEELNEKFGDNRVFFLPCDVTRPDNFRTSFKAAVEKLGGLDILVNNAAILNDVEWNLTVDVNLKGVIQGTLLALETMGKQNGGNGGTVLNVSSTVGIIPMKFYPVYGATKFAVRAFSKSVAESFGKTGVAVKIICPDATNTDLLSKLDEKLMNFIEPEEFADFMKDITQLSPETMAKTMLRELEEAPNGAVWYQSYGQPPRAVITPELESILAPIS